MEEDVRIGIMRIELARLNYQDHPTKLITLATSFVTTKDFTSTDFKYKILQNTANSYRSANDSGIVLHDGAEHKLS